MLINIFKFKNLENDYDKINFIDKSDINNPFNIKNIIQTVDYQTPADISSRYLKTILYIEINNLDKNNIFNTRRLCNNKTFLNNNMFQVTDIIKDTLLNNNLKHKCKQVEIFTNNNINIFVELIDIHDKYKFIHQYQWLKNDEAKPFLLKNNFVFLSSEIQYV